MDPPIATVELDFFPAGCVTVVLVRKLVHLDNHLFYQGRSERLISVGDV